MAITATTGTTPLSFQAPVQASRQVAAENAVNQAQAAASKVMIPYATPVFKYDSFASIPIELIRDPSTGEVKDQIPSEEVVKKYQQGLLKKTMLGGPYVDASTSQSSTETGKTTAVTESARSTKSAAPVAAASFIAANAPSTTATSSVSISV
ncbi:MAG: hypothetical protein WCF85_00725 [Rhodospirillaceae bacterium]